MFWKKQPSAPSVGALANTPPAVLNTPATRFSELYGSESVHGARYFVVACASLALNAVLGFGIVSTMHHAKAVPYLVRVNAVSGEVQSKPVAAEEFKQQAETVQAVVTAEAHAWVREMMTLDPLQTRANLDRAATRMSSKAAAEFKQFIVEEAPFDRLAKVEGLRRTVDPITVDATQKGIAFVSVQTNEQIGAGEPIVKHWRFTIHYALDPQVDPQGSTENPVGFVVTHFARALEQ